MENLKIFNVIYLILVLMNGLMTFTSTILPGIIQLIGGIAIALSWFFFHKKTKELLFVISSIGLILAIFYGYLFFKTTDFFPGIMTGVSTFFVGAYVIEIVKYYINITKP